MEQHIPHGLLDFARWARSEHLGRLLTYVQWRYLLNKELCPKCQVHIKNYEEVLGEHKCP